MKNSPLSKLVQFTIFFVGIILIWNYQDRRDFDKIFKVIEGKLIGPVAVTDIQDYVYVNGKGGYNIREDLKTKSEIRVFDSILKPIRENKLSNFNDTLPEINKETWDYYSNFFDQQAIKIDTFLIRRNGDTLNLKIDQLAVFRANYIFRIAEHPYFFSIRVDKTPKWNSEMLDSLSSEEKINLLREPTFNDPMRFEDFENHVQKINKLLDGEKKLKVSFKNVISERNKNMGAVQTYHKAPYIIENLYGIDLYKDESGFEMLAMFDEYLSWKDSIFHLFLFWFFVIVWVYLAFSSYQFYQKTKKTSTN